VRIEITPAALSQALVVHGITQAAFAEYVGQLNPPPRCLTETVDDVTRAIRAGGALIAWLDGEPVGSLRYAYRVGCLWVERVSVLPVYRGLGIASELLHAVETIASTYGCDCLRLSTRLALPRNVALYQHLGYRIISTDQVAPGADIQVTLEKRLETFVMEPITG
jgi:GNAT superfamily N-acetyltransferase